MTKHAGYRNFYEYYEYHGNTIIEKIRKRAGKIISQEWILFNTVEEAQDYFNNDCEEFGGYYV